MGCWYVTPWLLTYVEDDIYCALESVAEGGKNIEDEEGMLGVVVLVLHTAEREGKDPHADVGDWVDEYKA